MVQDLCVLSNEELMNVNGGFISTFLVIGGVAAAGVAIFEAGRFTGELIATLTR